LEKRLTLWKEGKFDVLLQEAIRCNNALPARKRSRDNDNDEKVFSRLMLQGKVRAAVRWITDRSKNKLLEPNDVVEVKDSSIVIKNNQYSRFINTRLPSMPHSLSLLDVDVLPQFEDVIVTGAIIHKTVFSIQGALPPGGCDAGHWQDVLLRYGSCSSRLRDAAATLACLLANNILCWNANWLIALDKNPGVRPIGIGETLRRLISKGRC
jgi:hypothetical protein